MVTIRSNINSSIRIYVFCLITVIIICVYVVKKWMENRKKIVNGYTKKREIVVHNEDPVSQTT